MDTDKIILDELPPEVTNPFESKYITDIYLHMFTSSLGVRYFTGNVTFKNQNTEAAQKFEANSMGELYIKIRDFCLGLESCQKNQQ